MYAEGGLAREEVARRLRELETAVTKLRATVDSLQKKLAQAKEEIARIKNKGVGGLEDTPPGRQARSRSCEGIAAEAPAGFLGSSYGKKEVEQP